MEVVVGAQALILCFSLLFSAAQAQPHPDVQAALSAYGNTDTSVAREDHVGPYTVILLDRPWRSDPPGSSGAAPDSRAHKYPLLTVVRAGVPLWHGEDLGWTILSIGAEGLGKDRPGMIALSHSGGAHCCMRLFAFELGEAFLAYPEFSIGNSMAEVLSPLPGEPLTVRIWDDVFAYWNTSYGDSPQEEIYLTPAGRVWNVRFDLMIADVAGGCARARSLRGETKCLFEWGQKVDLTDPKQISDYAAKVRDLVASEPDLPSDLWAVALRFIYTGYAAEGWRFIRESWPADKPGQDDFMREVVERLQTSHWWGDLYFINGEAIEEPLQAAAPSPTAPTRPLEGLRESMVPSSQLIGLTY